MFRKILLFLATLIITSSVSAIPPPDALASIWQSLLQIIGVASVFIAGAFYSLKQYLGASWKRAAFITLGLVGLAGAGIVFSELISSHSIPGTPVASTGQQPPGVSIPGYTQNDQGAKSIIDGELLSIDEVINRETDDYTRNWKRQTYQEMIAEANYERHKDGLDNIRLQTITSFTPEKLYQHLKESPKKLFFLDVRGAYEQKMFYLPFQAKAHYGDLVHGIINDQLKQILPTDKRIVVLCHSGLRGYLAANVLAQQGYKNVAFLQGGLANWNKLKLPIQGNEDYSANLDHYKAFSEYQAKHAKKMLKVEIDPGEGFKKDMPDLLRLPYEVTTSNNLNQFLTQSRNKTVLMVCRSYAGCFHTLNLGYMIEQAGGKVAGVFDRSGEFIVADAPLLVE